MDVETQNLVERPEHSQLRWLADVREQAQKVRIAVGNRSSASQRGADSGEPDPFVKALESQLKAVETKIERQMMRDVADHPAWEWLEGVRGAGPTLSTKILGFIDDIGKFDTVSKLWRFSGYAAIDGRREYPKKGEKLSYNLRLKTDLYRLGDSFIKLRAPYRGIYDDAKVYYRRKRQLEPMRNLLGEEAYAEAEGLDRKLSAQKRKWDAFIREGNKAEENARAVWTDGHVEAAARRKMVKIFLSHLWEVWREAEGLSVRKPYVLEHTEHQTYIDPWEFSSSRG